MQTVHKNPFGILGIEDDEDACDNNHNAEEMSVRLSQLSRLKMLRFLHELIAEILTSRRHNRNVKSLSFGHATNAEISTDS